MKERFNPRDFEKNKEDAWLSLREVSNKLFNAIREDHEEIGAMLRCYPQTAHVAWMANLQWPKSLLSRLTHTEDFGVYIELYDYIEFMEKQYYDMLADRRWNIK